MRRLTVYLLFLAGAVLTALYFNRQEGFVLIALGQWRVEVSLLLATLLLALTVLLLYAVVIGLKRLLDVPTRLRDWQGQRRLDSARGELTNGLLRFAEGDYEIAERQLIHSAKRSEAPLVNYLTAAIAAQRRGARDARDDYLATAEKSSHNALAVRLLQAQLETEADDWEAAQAILTTVIDEHPKHRRALELMVECCRTLDDWITLAPLMARIERYRIVPKEELIELNRQIARVRLKESAQTHLDALERTWQSLSRAQRRDPATIAAYADGLAQHDKIGAAEELIRRQLQKNWDGELISHYVTLPADAKAISERMAQIEAWLETRKSDDHLLYLAGTVAVRERQWGKANQFFRAACELAPGNSAYLRALASVQEMQGDYDGARTSYRMALEGVAAPETALPEFPSLPGPQASDPQEPPLTPPSDFDQRPYDPGQQR